MEHVMLLQNINCLKFSVFMFISFFLTWNFNSEGEKKTNIECHRRHRLFLKGYLRRQNAQRNVCWLLRFGEHCMVVSYLEEKLASEEQFNPLRQSLKVSFLQDIVKECNCNLTSPDNTFKANRANVMGVVLSKASAKSAFFFRGSNIILNAKVWLREKFSSSAKVFTR